MHKLYLLLAACLLINTSAHAQAGALDVTFNSDGIASLSPGSLQDVVYAIAIQSDQKTVFTGVARITSTTGFTSDMVIGRLKTDGSLDTTFANNGIYNLSSTGGSIFGYDMKIQPDGKIVVCGGYSVTAANTDFIVVRLNADGTPDTNFGGGDGISIVQVGSSEDYAYDIELLPNGNILLAGASSVPGFTYKRGVVMRMLPDGTLDNTFGTGGYALLQLGANTEDSFKCMSVLASGKIIAAGYSYINNNENLLVAGFNPNGTLDTNFAVNGIYSGTNINQAFDMAVDGNAVYLSGRISNSGGYDLGLSCLDTTGTLNTSFGSGGTVLANYNPIDAALGITIQPDGKIICVGTSGQGGFGNRDMFITRYLPTGVIDLTFATGGYTIIPVTANFEEANCVALQADGKIMLAGFASFTNNDMVFIRLTNDLAVGLSANSERSDIAVYPVPVTGSTLWIKASEGFGSTTLVELFDLRGSRVATHETQYTGELIEFPMPAHLPSGTYTLRILSDGVETSRTIVK
ncbi:MAG: T9SS type A sorting domain-containing protein [Bacteroidota bacterium]